MLSFILCYGFRITSDKLATRLVGSRSSIRLRAARFTYNGRIRGFQMARRPRTGVSRIHEYRIHLHFRRILRRSCFCNAGTYKTISIQIYSATFSSRCAKVNGPNAQNTCRPWLPTSCSVCLAHVNDIR